MFAFHSTAAGWLRQHGQAQWKNHTIRNINGWVLKTVKTEVEACLDKKWIDYLIE